MKWTCIFSVKLNTKITIIINWLQKKSIKLLRKAFLFSSYFLYAPRGDLVKKMFGLYVFVCRPHHPNEYLNQCLHSHVAIFLKQIVYNISMFCSCFHLIFTIHVSNQLHRTISCDTFDVGMSLIVLRNGCSRPAGPSFRQEYDGGDIGWCDWFKL